MTIKLQITNISINIYFSPFRDAIRYTIHMNMALMIEKQSRKITILYICKMKYAKELKKKYQMEHLQHIVSDKIRYRNEMVSLNCPLQSNFSPLTPRDQECRILSVQVAII